MTSRFVSGGTIAGDGLGGPQKQQPQRQPALSSSAVPSGPQQWERRGEGESKRNPQWEAVQRDLEADRRRREEARRAQVEGGAGGEGRSLYEVLQANKAAKQAAFEEQNRIRNQFRALDDDEIEFLDGVRDTRREEEERVRRETEERLAGFRKAQKAAGTDVTGADVDGNENEDGNFPAPEDNGDLPAEWTGTGKKRKRTEREARGIVKGLKKRASKHEKEGESAEVPRDKPEVVKAETESKSAAVSVAKTDSKASAPASGQTQSPAEKVAQDKPDAKPKPKLGLVDYGSDEDDDD